MFGKENNLDDENTDSEKPKEDILDSQVQSTPKIRGEESDEIELAEVEIDPEAPSEADLAEMAQAIDAAIEDLDDADGA